LDPEDCLFTGGNRHRGRRPKKPPPPAPKHELVAANSGEVPDRTERQTLGHGAGAEWKSSGLGILDSAGENDVGKVIINGAEDQDITVTANFRAVIGPLNKNLPEIIIQVPKGGSAEVPVDMRLALGMHEKQYEYTTRIHGEFETTYNDDSVGPYTQNLEPRYLAVNEKTGEYEIMDVQTRDLKYPYGFTTKAGIEEALKLEEFAKNDGFILDGVDPGIVSIKK